MKMKWASAKIRGSRDLGFGVYGEKAFRKNWGVLGSIYWGFIGIMEQKMETTIV